MHDFKITAVENLPKTQKLVYDTIQQYQPIMLRDLSKLIQREKRSLSSAISSLQEKELVVLNDHYFTTTGNTTFKTKLKKPSVTTASINQVSDPEHDEWLRDVLKQKEQRQRRIQIAQYL